MPQVWTFNSGNFKSNGCVLVGITGGQFSKLTILMDKFLPLSGLDGPFTKTAVR